MNLKYRASITDVPLRPPVCSMNTDGASGIESNKHRFFHLWSHGRMGGNHGNTTNLVKHQRCNGGTNHDEIRRWSEEERRGGAAGGGGKDGLNKSQSPSAPTDAVQVQVVGVAIGGDYLCRGPLEMIDVCLGRTLCPLHPPPGFICVFKITWQQRGVGAFLSTHVSPEWQPDEFTVENNVFFIQILS